MKIMTTFLFLEIIASEKELFEIYIPSIYSRMSRQFQKRIILVCFIPSSSTTTTTTCTSFSWS